MLNKLYLGRVTFIPDERNLEDAYGLVSDLDY